MRRLIAALDRRLEALATLAYGPLPMDEYRVGMGTKLAVLALFARFACVTFCVSGFSTTCIVSTSPCSFSDARTASASAVLTSKFTVPVV